MAVYAGPEFADRGLIYCADAGNIKSFRTGSSVIRNAVDVVGITGNQGFIANGTVYSPNNGGIFSMDGTNDTIALPFGLQWCPTGVNGFSNITMSLWFNYVTSSNIIVLALNSSIGKYNYSLSSGWFGVGAQTAAGFSSSSWGGNILPNIWQNISITISPTVAQIYRNGIFSGSLTHGITTPYTGSLGPPWEQYVGLGGWPFAGDMNGQIGIYHFHNVVLTPSEILQNFNVLRGRYNI
jgi:hypothetical protein